MTKDRAPRLAPYDSDDLLSAEHDVDARFAEEDWGTPGGFVSAEEPPGGLVVRGRCPRCRAMTSFTFQLGTPGAFGGLRHRSRGRRPEAGRSGPETATAYCACGFPHAGRPAGSSEAGCGAYWKVALP